MRILLVDDDKDLCQLTKKVLVLQGYTVDAFCDAKLAIDRARENKPDLILMDIMLKGSSGPEIISSLKTDPEFKDVPVVFLTALATGEERSPEGGGLTVGGVRYRTIGKPYEIESLLAAVESSVK